MILIPFQKFYVIVNVRFKQIWHFYQFVAILPSYYYIHKEKSPKATFEPRKTMSLKKIERNYFKNEFVKRTKRIRLIEEFQTTHSVSVKKIVEYFIILDWRQKITVSFNFLVQRTKKWSIRSLLDAGYFKWFQRWSTKYVVTKRQTITGSSDKEWSL
jgi:hypothetical protein